MSALKPIKRSKQLAPLSREHHEALLFIFKIKQGLKNATPVEEMSDYINWYWNNFLSPHFREEEKILLPGLADADPLAHRLKMEHSNLTELITSPHSRATLINLTEALNDHIRFEEREFFPYIEKKLDRKQLDTICQQLEQEPHCQNKWENEFWVRKLQG